MNRRNFIKSIFLTGFVFILCLNRAESKEFQTTEVQMRNFLAVQSLVVEKGSDIHFYEGKGIKPVIRYLEHNNFRKAYVGDRCIGKASALLLVYGNAKRVYTPLISKSAIKVFEDHKVKYSADVVVDNIKNADGTDLCPMEKKVQDIDSPKKAYKLLKNI